MSGEVLAIENLDQYLLVKNGNYLYKIPFRAGLAVLKLYFGSRSWARYVGGTISNFAEGQTSFMPRARRATEMDCLRVWRAAGFRVFDTYDDVIVQGLPVAGYLLFEYLPGRKFSAYFADPAIALDARLETYRRFLAQWHRRHELAIRTGEPRLVHENGDMKHVMVLDEDFLSFDFEMTYRSNRNIVDYVTREILAYLKSLGKVVGPERFPLFLEETLRLYPDTTLLANTHKWMFSNPNPILRLARQFDYRYNARARKQFSKYNVARQLHRMLTAAGSGVE